MITQELSSEENHFYRLVVSTIRGDFIFSSESWWDGGNIGNFKLTYKSADEDSTENIFYSNHDKKQFNSINSSKHLHWNLKIDSNIISEEDYCKVKLTYKLPWFPISKREIIFEHSVKGGILLEVNDSSLFRNKKQFYVNEDYIKYIKGLNYKKEDVDNLPIGIYKLEDTYRKNTLQFNLKYDE